MKKISLKYSLLFLSLLSATLIVAQINIPDLNNRPIVDQADLIPEAQENSFNRELMAFADSLGSQIAIFTFNDLNGDVIENVGIKTAEKWKVGRKGIDDGVIILVAKNDRKVRIEVGYGLEGALTDALSKRIIENIIKPNFRNGQFYLGLHESTQVIMSVIKGEDLPEFNEAPHSEGIPFIAGAVFCFFITLILSSILFSKLYKKKMLKGGLTIILGILVGLFLFSIVQGFVGGLFAMIIGLGVKPGGGRGGRYYGGYSNFGSGSSFGGGFGGGFSGGGGSFGGGGASGGW